MNPVAVIDIVGLTPSLLAHMPRVRAVGDSGWSATLGTILPAVTCSVQSTFLTGTMPREHGVVGNGWYFRELSEIFLWRQSMRPTPRSQRAGARHCASPAPGEPV